MNNDGKNRGVPLVVLVGALLMALIVMVGAIWAGQPDETGKDAMGDVVAEEGEDIITDEKEALMVQVKIDGAKYGMALEENETARALMARLPLAMEMQELNGNEKYYYMDAALPANEERVGQVRRGDVMLYGDDCLVIFYEDFATEYRYTRVGRIGELPELGKGSVRVEIASE